MNKDKFSFYVLYSLLIISFLLSTLEEFQENMGIMNLKYMMFIVIIGYYILFRGVKLKYANADLTKIKFILLFCYSIPTLINLFAKQDISILMNILLTVTYIVFLLVTIRVLTVNKLFYDFVKIIHATIFIFVSVVLIKEGFGFIGYNDIMKAFNVEGRIRQIYGFRHSNTLGNVCFIFISLSLYRLITESLRKGTLLLLYSTTCLIFYVMLASGSRTAVSATLLLVFLYLLNRHIYFKSKKSNAVGIIFTSLCAVLLGLLAYNHYTNINLEELLQDTNRYFYWVNTLSFLQENMNQLTGLGFYNISYFYTSLSFGTALTSDNWYIYTYMTLGLIGLMLLVVVVIIFISNLVKYVGKYNEALFSFVVSLFSVSLYYAVFEVTFFIPSELMSLLLWCTVFYYMEKISLSTSYKITLA